ncbi:unnamed protein product [Paramecium sonneborni]|uniref:Uncharacterized protein n=1 Tax=Paramecium sonneborni TaxID=65129 RepID=A0A8S1RVE0_9CILI|nr:unnamed protein product [Paramecium sonneborni]
MVIEMLNIKLKFCKSVFSEFQWNRGEKKRLLSNMKQLQTQILNVQMPTIKRHLQDDIDEKERALTDFNLAIQINLEWANLYINTGEQILLRQGNLIIIRRSKLILNMQIPIESEPFIVYSDIGDKEKIVLIIINPSKLILNARMSKNRSNIYKENGEQKKTI